LQHSSTQHWNEVLPAPFYSRAIHPVPGRGNVEMSQEDKSRKTARVAMRWLMAVFYFSAGVVHLAAPERFLPIIPDFVPMPYAVVVATGLFEIAGSVALLTKRLRRLAGIMLGIYAVCVFPANIKHAFEGVHVPPLPDGWWYHGPRLIMQPVLVWWALFCSAVVDWPCRKHRRHDQESQRRLGAKARVGVRELHSSHLKLSRRF
jgi:uncharacterized membrane protein